MKTDSTEFRELLRYVVGDVYSGMTLGSAIPFFYQGVIAGSEFLTYSANKCYVVRSFRAGVATYVSSYLCYFNLFDKLDNLFLVLNNANAIYNASIPSVQVWGVSLLFENFWFSRIQSGGGNSHFALSGYKLIFS